MPPVRQQSRQPASYQPGRTKQQHAHRSALQSRLRGVALRALVSGSVASVVSIAAATALARPRTGSAASASNAPSQWLWGEPARHRHDVTLRHTALGYCIHHASSVFWALAHEDLLERTRARPWQVAPVVAAAAMTVDYAVVPKRLSPGFERHLTRGGLVAVYGAFAAGLALGSRLARRLR